MRLTTILGLLLLSACNASTSNEALDSSETELQGLYLCRNLDVCSPPYSELKCDDGSTGMICRYTPCIGEDGKVNHYTSTWQGPGCDDEESADRNRNSSGTLLNSFSRTRYFKSPRLLYSSWVDINVWVPFDVDASAKTAIVKYQIAVQAPMIDMGGGAQWTWVGPEESWHGNSENFIYPTPDRTYTKVVRTQVDGFSGEPRGRFWFHNGTGAPVWLNLTHLGTVYDRPFTFIQP